MTGKERVVAAMEFRKPDRLPRYWYFWPEFEEMWRRRFGRDADVYAHFGNDMALAEPNETAWPTRAGVVRLEGDTALFRGGWGEVKRTEAAAVVGRDVQQVMGELVEPAVPERVDPDTIQFDDPHLDARFAEAGRYAEENRACGRFVWCKSGGPYLRAAFMRGEENFWVDLIEDPLWARAFVDRVVDHIMAVAIDAMNRFDLKDTGIGIFDDVSSSAGPFMGPALYEQIFLPALRRMVKTYKAAGARRIMHHSDGNVMPLLDMWIDAGVEAINPLEFRCGVDAVKVREKYGSKLICVGGLDNAAILPSGDRAQVRDHILYLLRGAAHDPRTGQPGGFVIGPHSIGPDISADTMQYVLELLDEHDPYQAS